MSAYAVRALIGKDLKLYYRNKFILVITLLSIVIFVVLYFVLPATVDETYEIGVAGDVPPNLLEMLGEDDEGIVLREFRTVDEMRVYIENKELLAGILLPEGWIPSIIDGKKPALELYFASDTPDEMVELVRLLLSELAFELSGKTLRNITWEDSVIGDDMTGTHIPYRERIRPLIAIIVLFMEIFGLAGLISEEVEQKTSEALLITSLTVSQVFTAKAVMGSMIAFVQTSLVMAIVGGFANGPLLILIAILLGSVMTAAVSFIMASLGKDLMSVAAWGMPVMILFAIPGFSVVIPGAAAEWVRYVPSYFLADTVFRVAQFDAGWSDVGNNLIVLVGVNILLIAVGILSLRRKYA